MKTTTFALRAAMTAVMSVLLFAAASIGHAQIRQTHLYIDDGYGNFTVLSGASGGAAVTFPTGGGVLLTNGGSGSVNLGGNFTTTGAYTLNFTLQGPTSLTLPTAGTLLANPMTTSGDMIYSSDNSGTPAKLSVGAIGTILTSGTGVPAWSATPTFGVVGPAGTTGSIALANSASANRTTLQAGSASDAVTYILPTAKPLANQVLTASAPTGTGPYTDQLSWTTPTSVMIISSVSSGNMAQNTYTAPMGPNIASNVTLSQANLNEMVMPVSGTLKNLYVSVKSAAGASKDYEIVVVVNGTETSLAADMADPATTGSDLTDTVSVNAGDLVSIYMTHIGGAAPATKQAMWSMEFDH